MAKAAGGARNGHLSKEELFARLVIREEDYAIPGGGTIRIRALNVREGAPFVGTLGKEGDPADRIKRLCLMGIIDPQFEPEDLEQLDGGSLKIISGIALAIMRLSGLLDDDDPFAATPPPKASSSTARKSSAGSRPR
ncbi:MAG TPA: hypothetical protein VJB57_19405 [Dehalococcoidia bacterium]|nr:hypothetical protein [Dehalococcoidia bacterium]